MIFPICRHLFVMPVCEQIRIARKSVKGHIGIRLNAIKNNPISEELWSYVWCDSSIEQ